MCRKNSHTPDSSIGKAGASLHRLSTGRPVSLAISPVYGRLLQSEMPKPQPRSKQLTPQRRSLPHAQSQSATNTPSRLQSRSAAILDHAADNIVNDLVNLSSPVAGPSTAIIDPNSSFGNLVSFLFELLMLCHLAAR